MSATKINYVTLLNGRRVIRSWTHRFANGGYVHLDRLIWPISSPSRPIAETRPL